jgi:hypothetical protein
MVPDRSFSGAVVPYSEMPEPSSIAEVQAVKHREIILHGRMNSDTAKAVVTMGSKILHLVLHFCSTKSFVDFVGIVPTYCKHNKSSEIEATDFDCIFYTTSFRKTF